MILFDLILCGIRDKFGIKLFTKIRVSFSDLRDHRFNHKFSRVSSVCSCGIEDEISVHSFLRYAHYSTRRSTLLSKISDINHFDVFPEEHLYNILVFGSNVYNLILNRLVQDDLQT